MAEENVPEEEFDRNECPSLKLGRGERVELGEHGCWFRINTKTKISQEFAGYNEDGSVKWIIHDDSEKA
jgi:hypothetical protein